MPSSSVQQSGNPRGQEDHQPVLFHYQIRMEIAVEEKTARVNVGGLFREMMRRVHRNDSGTIFEDVDEVEITPEESLSAANFGERFKVEQVTLGKMKKVTLGFFVKTVETFTNFKVCIGHQWLRDNKIYLREQALPFEYGTNLSLIGFYIMEHPWFGNVPAVLTTIATAWAGATTAKVNDDDAKRLNQLEQDGVFKRGVGVNIPFTIERTKMTVKSPEAAKQAFTCDVWHVYVPRKYHPNATFINDIAILEAQNLPQMIPAGLAKNNPTVFYQRMAKHARFMFEHRNITINNVTNETYKNSFPMEINNEETHISLYALLDQNKLIYRHLNNDFHKHVNVSVNAKDFEQVTTWLDQILKGLSINAWVKTPNNAKATASRRSDRYSKVFTAGSSDDGSFDPSTIASQKTKNPWTRSPPLELVFDAASEDHFPPLPVKDTVSRGQTAPSTSTQITTAIEVEEMLAKAISVQEQKFKDEIEKLAARNKALEDSLNALTAKLNATLNSIADKTVAAMKGPNSPFFTKADATAMMERQHNLQGATQVQLDKILQILHSSQGTELGHSVSQSPPRKNQRIEEATTPKKGNTQGSDQIMSDVRHEEVGQN